MFGKYRDHIHCVTVSDLDKVARRTSSRWYDSAYPCAMSRRGCLLCAGVGESPEFAGNVLLNVIGYFIGSLFFMLGGFLSWLEISQPDSKA